MALDCGVYGSNCCLIAVYWLWLDCGLGLLVCYFPYVEFVVVVGLGLVVWSGCYVVLCCVMCCWFVLVFLYWLLWWIVRWRVAAFELMLWVL